MWLEIYDIKPLKNFFDVIYDSANIIEMKLNQEQLTISLLNNSHVAFYNLEMSKDFFGDYNVDGVENILIFVEDFYNILKSASKDDVLYIVSKDSYLICRFENGTNRRVFELPLAEEQGDTPVPPSLDYNGVFDVHLTDLKQSCDDLDKIVKTDWFKVFTQENMMNIVAPKDALTQYTNIINIDSDEICEVIVNIDYIKQLLKLSKINDIITLKMGNSIPLSWNISSDDELVSISGLIAPIIEEEE